VYLKAKGSAVASDEVLKYKNFGLKLLVYILPQGFAGRLYL
jgi:hypothetical protein